MSTNKPDVAALVEQMPETDQPGQASKFTGPDPEAAARVFADILAGGHDSLVELIKLVRDPADPDFKSYKAGYVLHGLALYVGGAGREQSRRWFAETLAGQLGNHQLTKGQRGALIRELQVAGAREAVHALGQCLAEDDLCEDAAQALVAIRDQAVPPLRKALSQAVGKCRVTLLQALGTLEDQKAAGAMSQALGDGDPAVRLAAGWALANLGQAKGRDALLQAADRAQGWERIKLTQACLLLAERLLSAGKQADAARVYERLRDTRTGAADRHIRELATRQLLGLNRARNRP